MYLSRFGNVVLFFIGSSTGLIVAFSTFFVYVYIEEKTLSAATAFTAVNLLGTVGGLLSYLPQQAMSLFKAQVSLRRIEEFLGLEELGHGDVGDECRRRDTSVVDECRDTSVVTLQEDTQETSVVLKNASFEYYASTSSTFTLHNLNIEFPQGQLTLLCGSIGSGKSSLLKGLLGELRLLRSGSMKVPSTIGYAAQVPWLFNATIRENILFGCGFESERYCKVVKACQLLSDFGQFPDGDLQEIGERGVTLSGGTFIVLF